MAQPPRIKANKPDPTGPFKAAVGAAVRTIAGKHELEVSFTADRPILTADKARLAALPRLPTSRDIAIARGQGDAMAMRMASHDADTHRRLAPRDPDAKAAFDALEQARVESLGCARMAGMSGNIAEMIEDRLFRANYANVTDIADAPLAEALGLMMREKVAGIPIPPSGTPIVDLWRERLEGRLGTSLDDLAGHLDNQTEFSRKTRSILRDLDLLAEADPDQFDQDDSDGSDQDAQNNQATNGEEEEQDGDADNQDMDGTDEAPGEHEETGDVEGMEADSADTDEDAQAEAGEDAPAPPPQGEGEQRLSNQPTYKIFTDKFDEIVSAADLCPPEELDQLRQLLDKQLEHLAGAVARLANKLQRRLMAQQNRGWDFDLEEGVLDTARLTRVVTDPLQALSFKAERDTEFRDTCVTLLIDNSGSMRGRPITIAAICGDILARTLERCGVKVEILGFTTRAWKGGKSREAWLDAGRPPNPGRVNDIRHIIYKGADEPWRHAKRNLGLMMREGLLKENIDGEALQWAHKRIVNRPENRRILMVISDGAPVDDSTQSVNPGNYLEAHLRAVIEEIETRSPVQLVAIGIGHDVTRYYRRAVTILDADELAGAMTDNLAALFDEELPGEARRRR
ncbi:cobaltochelatase subunit CobT [Pelagibacterium halotolerans]|uniref:Cobaltochelatase subunit CobT n=1 Tax=Pelagibacterium halotolerans (strain DSM 22347 / JCM 15775 / CGMCC 1.7692 / B2) TaxID=1082931 RepID=G4REY6_PELHB|nr:cobaltochelatase subunit CobT [Pelagibacterium halotolerans]AEQ52919.1 aerobic cobaltochelatase CobT subunit [Pelagibacterium halotolerans B2]QJR17411.1 cobaltochelatase subunit CobT [Pelagibacterium halotolerans]SEA73489.1 cobaltochelatase CobT subunit [Pelagibacterium halotolerans]